MAYNENISNRIREALENMPNVEEKTMLGGICYMVNGKMCIGVVKDEMMCRIGEERQEEALQKNGCREMDFSGRPMKGDVYVSQYGMRTPAELNYWVNLSLAQTRTQMRLRRKNRGRV